METPRVLLIVRFLAGFVCTKADSPIFSKAILEHFPNRFTGENQPIKSAWNWEYRACKSDASNSTVTIACQWMAQSGDILMRWNGSMSQERTNIHCAGRYTSSDALIEHGLSFGCILEISFRRQTRDCLI